MKGTSVPLKQQKFVEESNLQRLLDVLYLHPDVEFSLTELAQRAGISKSAASRLLSRIQEANLITIKEIGPVLRIQANRESFDFIKRKIAWNLGVIYNLTLIEHLDEKFERPRAIVLFGSFRTGRDQTNSDIDIAIETNEDEEHIIRLPELKELEQELHRPIQIHVFNRKTIDPNVFTSIANGIVLLGFLDVKP